MKTVTPDYYKDFRCIADRCRHTCCVGWEIDVDADSLARYQQMGGPLGEKLRENIVLDDCPHFRLTKEERCPFLDGRGLCELILQEGEGALCQICTDHPRFRNQLAGREELGLGLCCEAAAALILGQREKTALCVRQDDGRQEAPDPCGEAVLALREQVFALLQDRSRPVMQRLDALLTEYGVRLPALSAARWAELFLSLERLDEDWGRRLEALRSAPDVPEVGREELELPLEQLAVYFVYRHLPAAQDGPEAKAALAFAVLSVQLIRRLYLLEPGGGEPELAELARLYSSEIEYSEENTDALLDLLWEENAFLPEEE